MRPATDPALPFDAVLLAGGRASRLDGIDKTALGGTGRTLLDRAVAATVGARRVVVVGLRDGSRLPVGAVGVREDPPFGGPVAALAAGLCTDGPDDTAASAPTTLVLACDLVRPTAAVALLWRAVAGADTADGWIAVDDDGVRQPLLGLYRTTALRAALAALDVVDGASLRRLLAPLDLVEVPVPSELCADVDTPEAVARLR